MNQAAFSKIWAWLQGADTKVLAALKTFDASAFAANLPPNLKVFEQEFENALTLFSGLDPLYQELGALAKSLTPPQQAAK